MKRALIGLALFLIVVSPVHACLRVSGARSPSHGETPQSAWCDGLVRGDVQPTGPQRESRGLALRHLGVHASSTDLASDAGRANHVSVVRAVGTGYASPSHAIFLLDRHLSI